MNPIKQLLDNKEYNRVVRNIFSLATLNGINTLFPLILLPYLVRILGVEKYGIYAFSYVLIQYLMVFVNYGFPVSATRQAAILREDKAQLSAVFNSVLGVRLLFALLCGALVVLLTLLFGKFRVEPELYLWGIGLFLGNALIPNWLFQGLEEMKYMTIIQFITRLLTLTLIFIFVKNPGDYIYLNLFHAIGMVSAGIISLIIAVKIFSIKIRVPAITGMAGMLKDGYYMFISTLGMDMYRQANPLILGFLWDYRVVAFYVAAEKIIKVCQSLLSPITLAMFPFLSRKFAGTKGGIKQGVQQIKKVLKLYVPLLLALVLLLIISARIVVRGYLGSSFMPSAINIQILSVVVLLGGLNYLYGIAGLVNMGHQKRFSHYVLITGGVSIITCLGLSLLFKDVGAALTMVAAEALLFILIYRFYLKVAAGGGSIENG